MHSEATGVVSDYQCGESKDEMEKKRGCLGTVESEAHAETEDCLNKLNRFLLDTQVCQNCLNIAYIFKTLWHIILFARIFDRIVCIISCPAF